MHLDLKTLVIIQSLTFFTQFVVVLLQYLVNRVYRGVGWWLAGSASMAVAFMLMPLVSVRPLRVLAMLANPLLVLGYIFLYIGIARFLGTREKKRVIIPGFFAFLVAYYYDLFVNNTISGRTIIVSITVAAILLMTTYDLLFKKGKNLRGSAHFTALIFLVSGAFFIVRTYLTFVSPPILSYANMAPVHIAAYLLPTITSTLWTFGFIIMINQRLHAENLAEREKLRTLMTERMKAEAEKAELEAKNQKLQKAESLARMAGAIAHHFNNQLQVVMGNLDLASSLPDGTAPRAQLAKAKAASEKAADISNLMLTYLGQASREQEPHLLSELIRDSLPHLRDAMPPAAALETRCPSTGPVINANAGQIQQVLTNLVTNAWEALGGEPGTVWIGLDTCRAEDIPPRHRFPIDWQPLVSTYASLEVSDTGRGIVEGDIEKMFDPFYSTQLTGRGLGLSVVIGIVQAHGGVVTVESTLGRGSTFRVHFPVNG